MKRSRDTRERDVPHRPDELTNARREEEEIDRILADSFPASDVPPWTLGVVQAPRKGSSSRRKSRGKR
jgi:hypothetical protein